MGTISRAESGRRRFISLRTKYLLTYLMLTAVVIVVLNTYPVTISRDLVFVSKENAILPSTMQIGSSVEALERMTPETVAQVMSMVETGNLSRVSIMNTNMDELYSVRNDVTGYDERVLFTLARAAVSERKDEFRTFFSDGAFMSYSCVPIMTSGTVSGAVCVYEYDSAEGEIVLGLRDDLTRISLGLGLAAIVVSVILSETMNHRLRRIVDAIKNVREGEYTYRVSVSGHDELTELSSEFNSLTDRLQQTEEIRRRFVADASHELKTPLAAIRLLSDSILETENMDGETVKEFVGGIREESERLARTTGQLLALTKLDNTSSAAVRVPVDCREVAGKVLNTLKPIAEKAGVDMDASIDGDTWIMATADELFQIIYNLTENAIKYNREGGRVSLSVSRSAENVTITVEDTGIGIPEDDLPHIFDRFYRVDKSRGRDAGGTGLGLSIVKSTANRHGGDVTAENIPAGGMRFTVTFPAYKKV